MVEKSKNISPYREALPLKTDNMLSAVHLYTATLVCLNLGTFNLIKSLGLAADLSF